MPPKAKFSREEIISAALKITRESGFEAVTARALGEELKSSARPVFTVFENMEEVLSETVSAAKNLYNQYIYDGLSEEIPFKGVGTAYIRFARNEPNFFRLLFMSTSKNQQHLSTVLPAIDENSDKILESIMVPYKLERQKAFELYKYLWIFSHGIATLCATNVCNFTDEEISRLLTAEFVGMLKNLKS